jgi:excisionase family DNA binding protein
MGVADLPRLTKRRSQAEMEMNTRSHEVGHPMQNSFEPLITVEAAAALLGIHPKTLERMARRGEAPALKIGRYWRFRATGFVGAIQDTICPPALLHNGIHFLKRRFSMQARYQHGTLTRSKRKRGPDVWQWRWSEKGSRLSIIIGTVEKFPNRAAAMRAADVLRLKVNLENPQSKLQNFTVGTLIDRYVAEEIQPTIRADTALSYRGILQNWIRPQ